MDLSPFTGLFSSLTKISNLNLEVWDKTGRIYSSLDDGDQKEESEFVRRLAAQIIEAQEFKYQVLDQRREIFGIPLLDGDTVIGTLIAYRDDLDKSGPPKDVEKIAAGRTEEMETFLNQAAELMGEMWIAQKETDKMAEDLTMYFEDLSLYSRTATQFRTLKFSETMIQEIVTDLLETMRTQLVFVCFPMRQEFNMFLIDEDYRDKFPNPEHLVESLVELIPSDATSQKEDFFIINDSKESPGFAKLHPDPYRFLAVTVKDKEKFYGWMGLVSFRLKEIFRRSELSLVSSIAQQLASAISNTDLYKDLEDFVINVVKSLVYTIEAKDVYTRGHSERVNYYSMMIAEELDFDENTRKALNWASILHDIGKIGIPEEILNKPGRLTDEEYDIIKGHPEKGRNILAPLKQLAAAIPGILHHHEHCNGKGYPFGLKKEEIPLEARIIAVADTFDAINSTRAYRPAKTPKDAIDIISSVAGEQLDDEIVTLFLKVYRKTFKAKGMGVNGSRRT